MKQLETLINNSPPYSLSKYRSELMGLAMVGVLCMHLGIWTGTKSILSIPAFFAYTDTFFILSGFGIYYSMAKNPTPSLLAFYRKRFKRVFLPYVCISMPMFISITIANKYGIGFVLANVSTLNLWYEGNPYGMWYIGTTIAIYLIYPFLHRLMYPANKLSLCMAVMTIFASLIVPIVIYRQAKDYYEMNNVIWIALPSFLAGSLLGYCSSRGIRYSTIIYIIAMIVGWGVAKYLGQALPPIVSYGVVFQKLALLPLLTMLMILCASFAPYINWVLKYLGKYSLEIYVLHLLGYNTLSAYYIQDDITGVIVIIMSLVLCKAISVFTNKIRINYI